MHIKSHQLDDLVNLLESLELKTDYSKYSYKDLKEYILNDKKVSKGKFTFGKGKGKSESNTERYKRVQKENTETIKKMIRGDK